MRSRGATHRNSTSITSFRGDSRLVVCLPRAVLSHRCDRPHNLAFSPCIGRQSYASAAVELPEQRDRALCVCRLGTKSLTAVPDLIPSETAPRFAGTPRCTPTISSIRRLKRFRGHRQGRRRDHGRAHRAHQPDRWALSAPSSRIAALAASASALCCACSSPVRRLRSLSQA